MEDRREAYMDLVGKYEVKNQLGRSRRIWEHNIKKYLQEVGLVSWTRLIWRRTGTGGGDLVNAVMSLQVL